MPRLNIIGPTDSPFSQNVDYQKTQNFYIEQTGNSEIPYVLYGTPGSTVWAAVGSGPIKAQLVVGTNLVVISGDDTYKINTSGISTLIDSASVTGSKASIASIPAPGGGYNTVIVDGTGGFVWDGTTFSTITDADFPNGATKIRFLDGRLVVNDPANEGRFYVSSTYPSAANLINGAGWTSLAFATAEGDPDTIQAVEVSNKKLFLIGEYSTEVWFNAGSQNVPFKPNTGMFMEWGTPAPDSVATAGDQVVFLSQNKDGEGAVVATRGGDLQIISPQWLQDKIHGYTSSSAYAYSYQWKGHMFYTITFPTDDITWVHDFSNSTWYQWSTGADAKHLSRNHTYFGGKHIVGHHTDGALHWLQDDVYKDGTTTITRIRRTAYVHGDGAWMSHCSLEGRVEAGVGDVTTPNPQVILRWTDNGHTFSNEHSKTADVGGAGEYGKRLVWRKIGRFRRRCFELKMTDPVKWVVYGAWFMGSVGPRNI